MSAYTRKLSGGIAVHSVEGVKQRLRLLAHSLALAPLLLFQDPYPLHCPLLQPLEIHRGDAWLGAYDTAFADVVAAGQRDNLEALDARDGDEAVVAWLRRYIGRGVDGRCTSVDDYQVADGVRGV